MPNIGLAERLLLDLGGLAHLVTEVVQLGATDIALTGDLDLVDLRGVHREGTLNADREADLTDGERLANAMTVTTDHVALEHLDTLTITLGDALVNLNVIANVEFGEIGLDLLLLDCANDIHCLFLLICSVKPLLVTRHDWTVYRHCPYRASYLVR